MSKIYDLLTVLESSTVTSPHFTQAREMIQDELTALGESVTDPTLRDSVMNSLQVWRRLDSRGTLMVYAAAITELKAVLKSLA